MKENSKDKSESGQIVILLALAFVGILAFTALAIDGAMIYSDRRIAQNGADAASISGAQAVGDALLALEGSATYLNWDCDTLQAQGVLSTGDGAAITHAGIVDFLIDNNINDNNGVNTECFNIFNGTYYETFIDVPVKITDDTPTAFLHLITNGTVRNEVEVKTRVRPRTEAGYGMTLLALYDPDYCDTGTGLEIIGNPGIYIDIGGIVSNSYLQIAGSSTEVSIVDGVITYSYPDCGDDDNGTPIISPPMDEGEKIDDPNIGLPDCSSLVSKPYPKKEEDNPMVPGIYSKNNQVINFDLTMEPGLYCIEGDLVIHSDIFNAPHVTLYMMDGSLTINAGSSLTFTAPPSDVDGECAVSGEGCPPALPGVMIYLPHDEDALDGEAGDITINGNSMSTFDGTIYAPNSHVKINGDATLGNDINLGVQVIAETIYIGGGANLIFNYPGSGLPIGDVTLEVAK